MEIEPNQRIDFEPSPKITELLDRVDAWDIDRRDIQASTHLLRRAANDILDKSGISHELSSHTVERSSMPAQFRYKGRLSALRLEDQYKFNLRDGSHTHEGMVVRLFVNSKNLDMNRDMNIYLIGNPFITIYDGSRLETKEQVDELFEVLGVIDAAQKERSSVLGLVGVISGWDKDQSTT